METAAAYMVGYAIPSPYAVYLYLYMYVCTGVGAHVG